MGEQTVGKAREPFTIGHWGPPRSEVIVSLYRKAEAPYDLNSWLLTPAEARKLAELLIERARGAEGDERWWSRTAEQQTVEEAWERYKEDADPLSPVGDPMTSEMFRLVWHHAWRVARADALREREVEAERLRDWLSQIRDLAVMAGAREQDGSPLWAIYVRATDALGEGEQP